MIKATHFGIAAVAALVAPLVLVGCAQSSAPQNAAPNVAEVENVVFIGDSITAGWGYDPDNDPMKDNFASLAGLCAAQPPPEDLCSSNNPGPAPKKKNYSLQPWVAYSYQFANMFGGYKGKAPSVINMAASGATPAQFDPAVPQPAAGSLKDSVPVVPSKSYEYLQASCNPNPAKGMEAIDADKKIYDTCDPNLFPGLFGQNLNKVEGSGGDGKGALATWSLQDIKPNTLTVGTLGANPILSRFLGLDPLFEGASAACVNKSLSEFRACLDRDIEVFRVNEHLKNTWGFAATRGPVLVQKLYNACPGLFGNEASIKPSAKVSSYAACESKQTMKRAYMATDRLNEAIDEVVAQVRAENPEAKIAALCPGNAHGADGSCISIFSDHQQGQTTNKYGGSYPANNPWLLSTDSGLHPNATGHRVLAQGVMSGACEQFGLWCDVPTSGTQWWPNGKKCLSTYLCGYAAVKNNTDQTWTLKSMTQDKKQPLESKAGEWILFPPDKVRPGETATFVIHSRHASTSTGAKGSAAYSVGDSNLVTTFDVGAGSWLPGTKDARIEISNGQYKVEVLKEASKLSGTDVWINASVSRK